MGDVRLGKCLESEIGERRPAPQGQGMPKLFRPFRRLRSPGALGEDTEAVEIELARPYAQAVARRLRLEHLGPERFSQLRNEVLQRRRCSPRRLLPQRVDQTIHRDHAARLEQQQGQDGALLLAAEQKRPGLVGNL